MRKASIELMGETKVAYLQSGVLGMGKCLFMVVLSEDMRDEPTAEQWARALSRCQQKAVELNYEVVRIRGLGLTGTAGTSSK